MIYFVGSNLRLNLIPGILHTYLHTILRKIAHPMVKIYLQTTIIMSSHSLSDHITIIFIKFNKY